MSKMRIILCALTVLACGCGTEQVEVTTGTPMPTMTAPTVTESEYLIITNDNFQSEVIESKELVLLDCWAPWCGPCKMLEPTIAELAAQYEGQLKVAKLNVDDAPEIATQLNVTGIPAVFLFNNGEVSETLVGVQPKENYTAAIDGLE